MPSFSVIIPCYRDEDKLAYLLYQLHQLPRGPEEIIVVDGADSESCREICNQYSVHWLTSGPCRGEQLRAGAALAKAEVLWFLHADARFSKDSLGAMTSALEQGAVGGYFRFRFDVARTWPALILEPAIALRCRYGVPYGDQGIFVLREIYKKAGGHGPWPLFEEVPLVRQVRRLGHFQSLREPILVDPCRWQQDGWWRRTWKNRQLALNFARGVAPNELASRYGSDSHS